MAGGESLVTGKKLVPGFARDDERKGVGLARRRGVRGGRRNRMRRGRVASETWDMVAGGVTDCQ